MHERGAGPALFFLHGFPTSCFDWREIIGILSPRFRCVAFDFPGYGLSDKPDDTSYSLFDQADTAEAVAAALNVTEAHVISHDMGTSVHCELLARRLRGRQGFEITASTFTNGSMLQWIATITPFQKMLAANESLPKAMEVCATAFAATHLPALKSLMRHPEAWTADDEGVIHELMMHQDGHLRIPALAGYMRERYVHRDRWIGALRESPRLQFVWAQDDPIANLALGRELHRLCPQAPFTEIPDAGHFLVVEKPAPIAERIRDFDGRAA